MSEEGKRVARGPDPGCGLCHGKGLVRGLTRSLEPCLDPCMLCYHDRPRAAGEGRGDDHRGVRGG